MKLSPFELESLSITAEQTFNDLCTVHRKTGETLNEYNDPVPVFEDVRNVECGFQVTGTPLQREGNQTELLQTDGLLRVSLEQEISAEDEVTVRSVRYRVDNVWTGRTVRLASLLRIDTSA